MIIKPLLLLFTLLLFNLSSAQNNALFINYGQVAPVKGSILNSFGVGLHGSTFITRVRYQFGLNIYKQFKSPPLPNIPKEDFSGFYIQWGIDAFKKDKIELCLLAGVQARGPLSSELLGNSNYFFGPYLSTLFKWKLVNHLSIGAWGSIGYANRFLMSEARVGLLIQ